MRISPYYTTKNAHRASLVALGHAAGSAIFVSFAVFAASGGAAGCSAPASVEEAERKGHVAWLAQNPTRQSTLALGRLADKKRDAVRALEQRCESDPFAYLAAWQAQGRKAPWGERLLREGFSGDRAELAASELPRGDPALADYLVEMEQAIRRTPTHAVALSSLITSLGPPAHEAVGRLLQSASTRNAVCGAIGFTAGSSDSRAVLLAAPAAHRDAPNCTVAVVAMAEREDEALKWLGERAEPGLLSAAGRGGLSCPRVTHLWTIAFQVRAPSDASALAVPLTLSLRRCAPAMDEAVATAYRSDPRMRPLIGRSLEKTLDGSAMKLTCAELKKALPTDPLARDHASDFREAGCRGKML